jgi:hypothetical protein
MMTGAAADGRVSRREFLRRFGLGAATVFVVADGGLAYRIYDQGVFSEGRGPAFEALETWRDRNGPEAIVAAAVLAASAHNTQPWAFAVSDERIDLYADTTRTTGANDPLRREFYISLGCALENLVLAARANGYQPTVTLDPGTAPDRVATVDLEPGAPISDELYEAIGRRRSNRSEYTTDPVPVSSLAAMSGLVDDSVGPARLTWLTTEPSRRTFADLLVAATEAHTADEEQSQDSFGWWRGSWDEVQTHRDGLNIDGVGLPPLITTLAKILPAPSRGSADATFVERTRIQADSAAAFGIVAVDDPYALGAQLAGGRLLERLHLWATTHNLGFQHMNQITERIDRDRQLDRPSALEEPLAMLAGEGEPLGAFRIGTPTVAGLPSPRRSVEEVLR